jgi:hypothetical protein
MKAKLVKESLNEWNGLRKVFGKKRFKPGDIIVRGDKRSTKRLYLYVGSEESEDTFNNRVFCIGNISKNYYGDTYASLLFNTLGDKGIVIIRDDTFRHINRDEESLIKIVMEKEVYQKYINMAEEITGIKIKL